MVIEGGATNQASCSSCSTAPRSRPGTSRHHAGSTARSSPPRRARSRHSDVALLQAAIDLADAETAADRARFYVFARRGRPQSSAATARKIELRHRGQSYRIATSQIGPSAYRLVVDGASIEARLERLSSHEHRIEVAGEVYRTVTSRQGDDILIDVDGVPHRISRDAGDIVRNLAPAVVVSRAASSQATRWRPARSWRWSRA